MRSSSFRMLAVLLAVVVVSLVACQVTEMLDVKSVLDSYVLGALLIIFFLVIIPPLYKTMGLSDLNYALGLPQGSVRAIIALSLILLFAITSNHLFNQIGVGAKAEFAKQLLTTISTLVVAIVGFYFGTRAVATARGAAELEPVLTLSQASPVTLKLGDGKALTFTMEVDPPGEAVRWEIDGDEGGKLSQVKPGTFSYEAGKTAKDTVKLVFALVDHPEIRQTLEVKIVRDGE